MNDKIVGPFYVHEFTDGFGLVGEDGNEFSEPGIPNRYQDERNVALLVIGLSKRNERIRLRSGFAATIVGSMVATKTGAGYAIQADGSWRKVREKR